jgi:peptidyl-prolyl cis-trans isomerase C
VRTLFRLRSFLLAALAALALTACAQAAGDPSVAATVGDAEIAIATVEERFETAKANPQVAQQLEGDDGTFASQVQAQILSQLIRSQLLQAGAEELGVEVTDDDVAAKRDEIVEEFGGEEAFEQVIEQNNLTEDEVDAQLRDLALQDGVQEALTADLDVSDEEIQAAFEADAQGQFGEQRSARHILVETEAEAQQVLERLEAGEDFAAIATEVSTDTGSAERGGDLGQFGRGQMVPPFEEAVFGAEVGDVVGPVQTDFGFHVIEVTDVAPAPELSEVEDDIRDQLLEQQRAGAVQEWLTEQQAEAEIVVNPRFGEWDAAQGQVVPADPLGELREQAPGGGEAPELDLDGGGAGAGAGGDPAAPVEPEPTEATS